MTVVAVAGGTQGLGRSIVDQLVKHSEYKVLIFSRKVSSLFQNPSNDTMANSGSRNHKSRRKQACPLLL